MEWWELFDVLGEDTITEIVGDFYDRVWADTEEPWFRDMFTKVYYKQSPCCMH